MNNLEEQQTTDNDWELGFLMETLLEEEDKQKITKQEIKYVNMYTKDEIKPLIKKELDGIKSDIKNTTEYINSICLEVETDFVYSYSKLDSIIKNSKRLHTEYLKKMVKLYKDKNPDVSLSYFDTGVHFEMLDGAIIRLQENASNVLLDSLKIYDKK